MVRQIQQKKVYWFCRHCWQPMVSCDGNRAGSLLSGNLAAEVKQKKGVSSLLA
ncbi:hypothetical protein ACL6C3_08390 [Capilliphycus salinus ALCB114379]|uniref:hypothetical protein n=1 Tax=Capilliphycus salinus TaxID=2768948 RepID=UPI0039A53504